ncbi:glycoside hydrolase family 3 C-terminal domain-containing protein [Halogeometricum sp. S1BR25-6]|uniref:Glycoside hydrolase family 3 C-terminal domain-containing protein n=1 Tax=Halogeometricum salsisoli TaxID=2950536 RepID=A0ABU2GIW2_9EURY|nr:glycoside hydrolase family 3 N-terminal domain-containing protein [Halogeometricum sp. S1BR25-6]MDS0300783.1 glycoside hydrolase family 3 C-terminal domain-containing protein [Halogeometricum sp. S1BR25-6]
MQTGSTSGDGDASTERRVAELLDRMTLEEKAAQLGSVNAEAILNDDGTLDRNAVEKHLSEGIGHLTRLGGEGSLPPAEAAERTNELQTYLREETRLGIPAIPHEECLSGYMGPEGTAFPQMLGMASTWSPDLLKEVTGTIRTQLEAIGTKHALSPVLDIARDHRWGRVEETFGEDPYLVAAMACGYVNGLQGDGDGITATLKHFAGHGAGEGGKNRSSVNVGRRELRETHLFPFEAAIRTAGAKSVMNAYHDIDGVPCASDEWLLTDVLRGEWGFDGTVVSDYYSVEFLRSEHGVAADEREAGVMAVEAGIDVELPYTDCYGEHLAEAVEEGELSEATLDAAVRRVLRAKVEHGLLDDSTVDADAAADPFGTDEAEELTTRAARESMTLLKNEDDLLPIAGGETDSVAVVGPKADDAQELMGDYAYPAHYPEEEVELDATTPLDALRARGDEHGFDVLHEQGCTTTGPETDGFDAAADAAESADVALAFVGARSAVDFSDSDKERVNMPSVATSGEGCDVVDLGIPGVQQGLVERLHETGTPLVVVVASGKPHAIEWIAEEVPAVLQAWLPGERGGEGIASVLFGEHNPGGRLPVSIPRTVGQLPVHYSRKPNTANEEYVYTESAPLYPFGHGLSYTEFEYGDLSLSSDELAPAGTVTAEVTVANAGDRSGREVVQLYARAENPDQARPVQELVGFERVSLDSGESARVAFEVDATQLAYHDRDFDLAVEEGPYEFRVGRSAADVVSAASFEVTGTKEVPQNGRAYFAGTTVSDAE